MPATFSIPKKRSKRGVLGEGRPTKQTPALVRKVCDALAMGLNDEEAALVANITEVTFRTWRRDPIFVEKIKRAVALRLYKRLERIEAGADGWQGTSWCLERQYPTRFAKPEIQLSFNNNSVTQNFLSISISGSEAKAIEVEAAPIRESVQAMFQKYRPELIGNGEGKVHDIEAASVHEHQQTVEQPPITHQGDSDAHNPMFWKRLVTSNPECKIAKETAEFAARALLVQVAGYKGHRASIDFADDPTVGDLFALVERLCGGSTGWQAAQKLGGY